MKKQFLAICVLSAVMLSSCGGVEDTSEGEVQTMAAITENSETKSSVSESSTAETEEVTEKTETEAEPVAEETENTELVTETETFSSETSEDIVNRIKSIDNSAYDKYSFSRKYVDEVYDIYLVGEIVDSETESEWVNNVFLMKTPEEQEELPTIYQAIVALNISEEDLRNKNNELSGHLTEEMISALYTEDVNEMKRLLTNPWALYYNGEVYAFDEMYADPNIVSGVPADVMNEYLDFIETIDGVRVR